MNLSENFHYQWMLLCFLGLFSECMLAWSRDYSEVDRRPLRYSYVSRTWSEWTSWSPCSRTCGGGVRQRTRICRMRMVGYRVSEDSCLGERIEYGLCSKHVCPSYAEDFLSYQCSRRNGQTIGEKRVKEWVPYHYGKNPCELQCWTKDKSLVYSFGKVIDGTKCTASDPKNAALCVNGRCMPVDCAGQIGADNKRDKCGVCRGSNSTCIRYHNTFWRRPRSRSDTNQWKDRHYDYNEIFTIPAGATHIHVTETSDTNSLVLVDHKGKYLINGNWRIQSPGRFLVHATEFVYNRTWDGIEELSSVGPTRYSLMVFVLGSGDIPTVHYEYWMSTATSYPKSHFQHSSFPTKSSESSSQKHPYDIEVLQSLNNGIETSSEAHVLPATKSQGYKSYYHRNEILDSVPSWSIKRHRIYKHPTTDISSPDPRNYLASEKLHNRTNLHHPGNIRSKEIQRKQSTNTAIAPYPFTHSSAYVVTNYSRPNGTSAFTRYEHAYLKNENQRRQVRIIEHTRGNKRSRSNNEDDRSRKRKSRNKSIDRGRVKRRRKSNNDACPTCQRVRQQTKNFCSSDFVLRAVMLAFEKQQQGIRFEMEVTRSFKNEVPILSREYVWTSDSCQCPRLRVGKEYILMGHSSIVGGRRESRLIVDRNSFVRKYTEKRARTMLRLVRDQNSICSRLKS